jgi:hypothetical protein
MKRFFWLFACLIGLLAACGAPEPTPEPTPTPTPQQMLDRAADAVLALQSAQFRLAREGAPAVLDQATNLTFSEAAGQYQAPDRVAATVKASAFGAVLEVEARWVPEGAFLSNPLTGQFGPAPANLGLNGPAIFGDAGMPAMLRGGVQNLTFVGAETLDGVAVDHLRGQADGGELAALTAGALSPGALYTVDVWLEQATANPVRIHITEPDGSGWVIDLFDFNTPVTIVAP